MMINLEWIDANGKRLSMFYNVPFTGSHEFTVPTGAASVHVWLGTNATPVQPPANDTTLASGE